MTYLRLFFVNIIAWPLLMLSTVNVFGQQNIHQAIITECKEPISKKEKTCYALKRFSDDEIISLRIDEKFKEGIILDQFDNELNLIKSTEVDLNFTMDERKKYKAHITEGSKLHLFGATRKRNSTSKKLSVYTIDLKTKTWDGKKKDLVNQSNIEGQITYFDLIPSNNDSMLAIISYIERNGENELMLSLLDKSLNSIHSNIVKKPYPYKTFKTKKIYLDNLGQLHFFGKKYSPDNKGEGSQILISFLNKFQKKTELLLDQKYKNVKYMATHISDNTIQCAGLLGTQFSKFYTRSFSVTYNIISQKLITYDELVIEREIINDKVEFGKIKTNRVKNDKADPAKVGLKDYVAKQILKTSDGGSFVISEKVWAFSTYFNVMEYNPGLVHDWVVDNLLISHLDVNGKLLWNKKIGKQQMSANAEEISFFATVMEDDLHLLMNGKYGTKATETILYDEYSNGISHVIIDKKGDVKYSSLNPIQNKFYEFKTMQAEEISENEFIIYSTTSDEYNDRLPRKKKFGIAKIRL